MNISGTRYAPELPKLTMTRDEIKSLIIDKVKELTYFEFKSFLNSIAASLHRANIGFEKEPNTQ